MIVNLKRASVLTLGAVATAGLLVWSFLPNPVEVETARVVRGEFLQTVDEDGRTRVRNRFVVASPLAGTLQRIGLDEGDHVAGGDVVATILPAVPALLDARTERELSARLEAAEAQQLGAAANVGRAEAATDLARADAKRVANLAAKGFVSAAESDTAALTLRVREKELDAAQQERHVASHALDAARAALSQAIASAKTGDAKPWQVHAPAAGVVLRVLQESERVVATGTPLIEIGDPSDLEVVVDVLSSDAVSIASGNRVLFERWGGDHAIEGRVRRVEPSAFTKISALGVEEQRVNVIIDVVAPDERWRAVGDGFRVDARIVVNERKDVLIVPVSALFREDPNWMAFVLSGNRVHKRVVTVGAKGSLQAVVDAGLVEGDIVVVYPSSAVEDGTRVIMR
jgi:HlyD family secretion protein